MSDRSERIAGLTPKQRALLARRLASRAKDDARDKVQQGTKSMAFGLYFFSADGTNQSGAKYQLVLDAAQFADSHGFHSLWTPERHFQEFGGLYPNPSVLAAGLATITKRVQLRAGSVVLPLHSPVRVAEEWSVVDNLSGGRVGISTATGWHSHDYVIRPDAFKNRREIMFESIPIIQRLWRGEQVAIAGPDGEMVEVRSLPRPIQREIPIWITATSPETWKRAASMGCNIFTSLIGYSLEQLSELIQVYRKQRVASGHDPRTGRITLMLHTHLGEDQAEIKERVREPLKQYLVHFFEQLRPLMDQQLLDEHHDNADVLLDFAFERYFQSSSLLGSVEKCVPLVESLAVLGVDEIACLIDFGLPVTQVLAGLEFLEELRGRFV